ncbi:unnamed protein product [Tuber aestivum]|uniref:Uncharacterized protein n=1 Tax=Tuber aestivum TaxID=59557 RepID=A0A292PUK1_9PEZI|nr:unnamed protein product [Tuber aestivum]
MMFAKKASTLGNIQNQCNEEGPPGTLNRRSLSPKLDRIQPLTPNQIPHQESANHEPQYGEEPCVGFRTRVLFIESLDLNIEDPHAHREAIRKRQTGNNETITSPSNLVDSLSVHANSLDTPLTHITVLSGPIKLLRNSFISTFKRDKLGSATEDDLGIIRTSGD